MHASPPETTLKVGETATATTPASRSPSLGPPETTSRKMPPSRPRSASGMLTWRIVERKIALTTSAAPGQREEHEGPTEVRADQPERRDRRPPSRHRPDHGLSLPADPRDRSGHEQLRQGADGRRREEQTDDRRAPMELLDGEDREQRRGHAEDHRDQIDHERGSDQPMVPDVPEALPDRPDADRPLTVGARQGRERLDRDRGDQQRGVADEVDRVGRGRARPRDQHAGERGADDPGRSATGPG